MRIPKDQLIEDPKQEAYLTQLVSLHVRPSILRQFRTTTLSAEFELGYQCFLVANEYGVIIEHECELHHDKPCACLAALMTFNNQINPNWQSEGRYVCHYDAQTQVNWHTRYMSHQHQKQLSQHLQQTRLNQLAIHQPLHLSVQINQDELSLEIGTERSYKVRQIKSMVNAFRQHDFLRLSKKKTILCDINDFDDISRALFQVIALWSDQAEGNHLPLHPTLLDDLARLLPLNQQAIKPTIHIHEVDHLIEMSMDLGIDYTHIGQQAFYDLTHQLVYPLPAALIALYETLSSHQRYLKEDYQAIFEGVIQPYEAYVQLEMDESLKKEPVIKAGLYTKLEANQIVLWFDPEPTGMTKQLIDSLFEQYDIPLQKGFSTQSQTLSDFLVFVLPAIQKLADIYVSESLLSLAKKRRLSYSVALSQKQSRLLVDFKADNFDLKELFSILKAYRRKQSFYKLASGQVIQLLSQDLDPLDQLVQQLDLNKEELNQERWDRPLYQAMGLSWQKNQALEETLTRWERLNESQLDLPERYQTLLHSYQQEGVKWIRNLFAMELGGILADDMGLGKTLQVLCALSLEMKASEKALVVCPSSLLYNWASEIEKFNFDFSFLLVNGTQTQRQALWQQSAQLFITTYDYLRQDEPDQVWDYLILDEAQAIKNPRTKTAQSVKSLQSRHRLALSGTPIENRLTELWSIFDFIMPGYLYRLPYFIRHIETPIVTLKDHQVQERLMKMVKPFILRRKKEDVLVDLPDKKEMKLWLNFRADESQRYQASLAMTKAEIMNQIDLDPITVLSLLTRLRRLCCCPDDDQLCSKMQTCINLIETLKENQKQVLVFSSFTKVFEQMAPELEKRGLKVAQLTGSVPKEVRAKRVSDFQAGQIDVFLISLKAGGTGLNLTAAQAVIHYDPWWNMAAQSQATDRAYRIGQTKNVLVYQLLMKDSIEEKIAQLQEEKAELTDAFVQEGGQLFSQLSKEDIEALF